MKQDLWLANSGLVLIYVAALGVYSFTQQEVPVWKAPRITQATPTISPEQKDSPGKRTQVWQKIYQDDIFGTYIAQDIKLTKQSLLTPIPEPKQPTIPAVPDIKKQEFIAPLGISVRGIIASVDETRNVAMITDETSKEGMYHLGERIKDAQIIKIGHNRVVVLRANGQQETYYLRKDDMPSDEPATDKWKYIVRKVDDQNFNVDPFAFSKEVGTLGEFVQKASIIGTAYHNGSPVGIRIGSVATSDVAQALGLADNDMLTSINDINLADAASRVQAYESIIKLPIDSIIKVGIKRADKDVFLSYKLIKIDKPRKSSLPGVTYANQQPSPEEQMKQSRLQQREAQVRDFQKQHYDEQKHQQTMAEIRRRILENLQGRMQLAQKR
jgi:type II secretion system protein C